MIENYTEKLSQIREKYNGFKSSLKVEELKLLHAKIERELQKSDVYTNLEESTRLSKRQSEIKNMLNKISAAENSIDDAQFIIDYAISGELVPENELIEAVKKAEINIENLYLETLYSEKFDDAGALLTVHSGAGGEEAQDWADMLSRMFTRFAAKKHYTCEIVDKIAGDGAGIKSITFMFSGEHCYGNLKCERGVHRLVRISPFDANKRRHTSFASVEVLPIVESANEIIINPSDLKIDTYRSSGAGGQHVNKTESAIRITHVPTGIVVACQNERSQVQNKEQAMKMLMSKLIEREEKKAFEEKQKQLDSQKKIEWGSQIRSYVLHPYNMVKDHRTDYQTSDTSGVLDGGIEPFIVEYLKQLKG